MIFSARAKIFLAFFFTSFFCCEVLISAGDKSPALPTEEIRNQLLAACVIIHCEGAQLYRRKPSLVRTTSGRVGIIQRLVKIDAAKFGTGIIVSSEGLILTNAHNILGLERVRVTIPGGEVVSGEIVRVVEQEDIAIISIKPPGELRPVAFADSGLLALGDTVYAVANPGGEGKICVPGEVIGLNKGLFWQDKGITLTNLIESDIWLTYGSSGGPLFNSEGKLVGMNVAGHLFAKKSSFAIPSNTVRELYYKYLAER